MQNPCLALKIIWSIRSIPCAIFYELYLIQNTAWTYICLNVLIHCIHEQSENCRNEASFWKVREGANLPKILKSKKEKKKKKEKSWPDNLQNPNPLLEGCCNALWFTCQNVMQYFLFKNILARKNNHQPNTLNFCNLLLNTNSVLLKMVWWFWPFLDYINLLKRKALYTDITNYTIFKTWNV